MSSVGSVTNWLKLFQLGNEQAAARLWDYYFDRIVKFARRKMGVSPRVAYDEEDVALSAFKSLCNVVKRGRVETDLDRDHLWKLMATITLRKVYDCISHNNRQKRRPKGERVRLDHQSVLQELTSQEPPPDVALQIEDQFQDLLDALRHHDLKQIAVFKMEGYSNKEIAETLDRGLSTIERKLKTIRMIWTNHIEKTE